MMRLAGVAALLLIVPVTVLAQTPRPFPAPPRAATPPSNPQPLAQPIPIQPAGETPTEATLGVPIFPSAQFLASYDAGLGQRYYIFGAQASFTEIVTYYRTILKTRGEQVFEQPPTHTFEVGRFREEMMAFPPGVTIKDFTAGGSEGYANPQPGGTPERFSTVIQIVPLPAGARGR